MVESTLMVTLFATSINEGDQVVHVFSDILIFILIPLFSIIHIKFNIDPKNMGLSPKIFKYFSLSFSEIKIIFWINFEIFHELNVFIHIFNCLKILLTFQKS